MSSDQRNLSALPLAKGDEVRLTRPAKFQTPHNGWGVLPIGTRALVTSASEATVFALVGGLYEMELLAGEYERV